MQNSYEQIGASLRVIRSSGQKFLTENQGWKTKSEPTVAKPKAKSEDHFNKSFMKYKLIIYSTSYLNDDCAHQSSLTERGKNGNRYV